MRTAGQHDGLDPAGRSGRATSAAPSRVGILSNSSLVNCTISEIIQCPQIEQRDGDRDRFRHEGQRDLLDLGDRLQQRDRRSRPPGR